MTLIRTFLSAVALAAMATLAPTAEANGWHGGGGGHWNGGGGGHWNGGGHWHGGGYWHGGYCCYGGYWPGAFWGGVAIGVGVGAVGYYGAYPGYYYGPTWGTYYDTPPMAGPTYSTVDPAAHSGQPVPQASQAPEPIFYPRNGQSAETTENDRRDCNRWATTQRGAMADASIFHRATLACMEGRGYTVK
ncbi:MAG TPA: hypothetical protein VH041_17935 [Caldimonas sp.]|nr:hypothetical protein [Caldimonas sp.]HEX4236172.1 hypothetical protein [Caldimonas sp.]